MKAPLIFSGPLIHNQKVMHSNVAPRIANPERYSKGFDLESF